VNALDLEPLKTALLTECALDFEGLWSVAWRVEHSFPELDSERKREATLQVIRDLLVTRQIIVGTFASSGGAFLVWSGSVDEIVSRIDEAWRLLGRDPDIGEIAWITTSDFENIAR
jgi:hypothetical protein